MIEYRVVKGFENYTIGNDGVVINNITGKPKKPTCNHSGKGYFYVDLYNKNIHKRWYIHRLVAENFIPNKEGKPYINHKDGDPSNNNVNNLEWCTPLENVEHASKIIKTMHQYNDANNKRKKKVKMLEKNTHRTLCVFESIRDAERATGIPSSNICACLKNRQSYTKEYAWCYVEELKQ